MSIIVPFHGGVTSYVAKTENGLWISSCPCPLCGRETHRHGKYKRTVYSACSAFIIFIFRRFCPDCNKTFSLIPSFLKPYARFLNDFRLRIILSHVIDNVPINQVPSTTATTEEFRISITTFRRWLKRLTFLAPEVNVRIAERLYKLRPDLPVTNRGKSPVAYLLDAGAALAYISSSFLSPAEHGDPSAVFDMLNILLKPIPWI